MITESIDPDDWDEDEWIRRLDLHAARYNLTEVDIARATNAINNNAVTIGLEGELIVRDPQLVTLALMEADLARTDP